MIVGAEPLEVFGWQATGQGGYDVSFAGQMRFKDEILMQFDCGFKSPSRAFIEIVGTEATLNVPHPFKPGLKNEISLNRNGETQTIRIKGGELYSGEVEDMCNAVLHHQPPLISLADSRGNIAAILGLIRSARSGNSVAL